MTNGGDIVCDGARGCGDVTLDVSQSETSDVYCVGASSCEFAIIEGSSSSSNGNSDSNGNNTIVYCGAASSCLYATINNVETLYVGGSFGASHANINGVSNIYVTGSYGLSSATVNSGGVGNMNLYIGSSYNTSHNGATINCQSGDFCTIYCHTERSCRDYHVNGRCSNYQINCGELGNNAQWICPTVTDDVSNCTGMIDNTIIYLCISHICIVCVCFFLFFSLFHFNIIAILTTNHQ